MIKRRMTRRIAIPVVALGLMLTACQGIPTSGGVHQGMQDFSRSEQTIEYRPDSPMPDASPEEIIRGFLEAGSSPTNGYEIAREFLTHDYRAQWNPNVSATIDDGRREFIEGPDDTATMMIGGIATIDEGGSLTQIDTDETTQFQFELAHEDGEWRIASAPNGVILDRSTFSDIWSSHQLYFTGSRDTLVPDTRWFLNRATVGTYIVNELLSGPPEALTGVAYSAFPTGTRLSNDAVIIDNGTVHIDFSPEFESISEAAIEEVKLQLATSLYSVSGVSSYEVSIGGAELFAGPVGMPQTLAPESVETVTAAGILSDGTFGFLSTAGLNDDARFTDIFTELDPTHIVMNRDDEAAFALAPGGLYWVTRDGATLIDGRDELLEPTVDPLGYAWLMTADDPGMMTLWHPEHEAYTLETPELADERVVALRVAPDGNRMALLTSDRNVSKILIVGIVRDDTGAPQRFVDLESPSVSWTLGAPLDLDWVDASRVAVLSQGEADATRFTLTGPGQFTEARSGVQGAVALRSGGRSQLTYLLSDAGDLSAPQGTSGWQRQVQDVQVLSKRG